MKSKLFIFLLLGLFAFSFASATVAVTLNSPSNGAVSLTNAVNTSSSISITGGAYLLNVTLYDNSTGTWGARNATTSFSGSTQTENITADSGWDSSSSQTLKGGANVSIINTMNVTRIIKPASSTATKAYIYWMNNNTLITSASFVGNYATVNTILTGGKNYTIVSDNNGSAYNWAAKNYGGGYPIAGTNLNWLMSNANLADYSSAFIEGILGVEYILSVPTSATIQNTNTYSAGQTIKWNYKGCDNNSICNFSTNNFTFSLDSQAPSVVLNSPTSIIDYGYIGRNITLNFTATDSNLGSVWYNYNGTNISIAGALSGVSNISNITLFSSSSPSLCYQESADTSNQSGTDNCAGMNYSGSYNLAGDWLNPNNAKDGDFTTYASFDFVAPAKNENFSVNYSKPTNALGATWKTQTFINSGAITNVSILDTCFNMPILQLKYVANFTPAPSYGSQGTFYCYNGTWNPLMTGNAFYFWEEGIYWNMISGGKTITLYANDTIGNLNSSTYNWDYKVFENSQTYVNSTSSKVTNNFVLNITAANVSSIKLNYNNTNYTATTYLSGSDTISSALAISPKVNIDTNISFKWFVTLLDSSTIQTDPKNQTVLYTIIGNNYSNLIYNITIRDDITNAIINNSLVTMSYQVTFGADNNYVLGTALFTDSNFTNKNISSNVAANFYLSGNIIYSSTGYIGRTYNFLESNISSPKNITLYLSPSNTSFVKTILVTDEAGRGRRSLFNQYSVVGGVSTLVASEQLDNTGKSTISFIPNVQYTFKFFTTGCANLTKNIIFYDQSDYTQVLSCSSYNPADYVDPFDTMAVSFYPDGVFFVNNTTNFNDSLFLVNVSGSSTLCANINTISFLVYDSNNNIIVNTNSNNCAILSGSGYFNEFATATLTILLDSGETKTLTYRWIKTFSDADYSNYSILGLISQVGNSNDILGVDWKFKLFFCFIGLFGVIIGLAYYQRLYNFSNLTILIIVDIYLWVMCFIGWGDIHLGATGGGITTLISKYSLFILGIVATAGIIATKEDEYS